MSGEMINEQQLGQEPDYRFSLANERTFLAWIRTALALLAGGMLLFQYGTRIEPLGLRLGLCSGLIMMSGALSLGAYLHWRRCDHAMRHNAPLPKSFLIVALAAAVIVLAMITAGSLVLL
jgi:putative membrane protein